MVPFILMSKCINSIFSAYAYTTCIHAYAAIVKYAQADFGIALQPMHCGSCCKIGTFDEQSCCNIKLNKPFFLISDLKNVLHFSMSYVRTFLQFHVMDLMICT